MNEINLNQKPILSSLSGLFYFQTTQKMGFDKKEPPSIFNCNKTKPWKHGVSAPYQAGVCRIGLIIFV